MLVFVGCWFWIRIGIGVALIMIAASAGSAERCGTRLDVIGILYFLDTFIDGLGDAKVFLLAFKWHHWMS